MDVPTLTWNPVRESNVYEVTVKNKNSQIVAAVDTYPRPRGPRRPSSTRSDGPFTWTVVSLDASGSRSPLYSGSSFNLSGNDPPRRSDPLTQLTGTSTRTGTSRT